MIVQERRRKEEFHLSLPQKLPFPTIPERGGISAIIADSDRVERAMSRPVPVGHILSSVYCLLHSYASSLLSDGVIVIVQGAELEKYQLVESEAVLQYYSVVDRYVWSGWMMRRFPMEKDIRTGGLLVLRRNNRQMKKEDEYYSFAQQFFSSPCSTRSFIWYEWHSR